MYNKDASKPKKVAQRAPSIWPHIHIPVWERNPMGEQKSHPINFRLQLAEHPSPPPCQSTP